MRKTTRGRISSSPSPSQSPRQRVLTLSQETVRTLTSKELALAVSGCPTGSSPTTFENSSGC
jgi:hypothetical protein